MCSKHLEAWNNLIVKQKFCASSWLITEINILRCTVSKTSTNLFFSFPHQTPTCISILLHAWHTLCPGKQFKSFPFLLSNFLQAPAVCSLSDPQIFLNTTTFRYSHPMFLNDNNRPHFISQKHNRSDDICGSTKLYLLCILLMTFNSSFGKD